MADKNLELLLRIIAQVDGLRDVEGLRESVESLDPALSGLADRARSALNPMNGLADSSRDVYGCNVLLAPSGDIVFKGDSPAYAELNFDISFNVGANGEAALVIDGRAV